LLSRAIRLVAVCAVSGGRRRSGRRGLKVWRWWRVVRLARGGSCAVVVRTAAPAVPSHRTSPPDPRSAPRRYRPQSPAPRRRRGNKPRLAPTMCSKASYMEACDYLCSPASGRFGAGPGPVRQSLVGPRRNRSGRELPPTALRLHTRTSSRYSRAEKDLS
jgi:hypothetical protein